MDVLGCWLVPTVLDNCLVNLVVCGWLISWYCLVMLLWYGMVYFGWVDGCGMFISWYMQVLGCRRWLRWVLLVVCCVGLSRVCV